MFKFFVKVHKYIIAFLVFLPSLNSLHHEEEECFSNRLFDEYGVYVGCSSEYSDQTTIFSSKNMSIPACNRYCYNSHKDIELPPCAENVKSLPVIGLYFIKVNLCTITTPDGIEIRRQKKK